MKLSICMMVRNEEKNLKRCLESLKHLRNSIESELIVVDTGSTDNSMKIAKKYTDKVYYREWFNDFSGMRNVTIGYAKGEWIFIIDADEEVDDDSELVRFLSSDNQYTFNNAILTVRNFLTSKNNEYADMKSPRIFRNDGKFKYSGRVHNEPVCGSPSIELDVKLKHYGYVSDDKKLMEKKFNRTSTLLIEELKERPRDVYYNYQLAVSYGMHNDFQKALDQMKKTYKIIEEDNLNKRKYLYVYFEFGMYYLACDEKDKIEKITKLCEEGISLEKDFIDLYFLLGNVKLISGKFEESRKNYEKYFELLNKIDSLPLAHDTAIKLYTVDGAQEAYANLMLTYYYEKRYDEAEEYVLKVTSKKYILKMLEYDVNIFFELKHFDKLYKYYTKYIYDKKDILNKFYLCIEKNLIKEKYEKDSVEVFKLFSNKNDAYSRLNNIRLQYIQDSPELDITIDKTINDIDLNVMSDYFGDLIYFKLKLKKDIGPQLFNVNQDKIVSYLKYCIEKHTDFMNTIQEYLSVDKYDDIKSIRLNRILERVLLVSNIDSQDTYSKYFDRYIEDGVSYIKSIYSNFVIKNELVYDVKDEEDGFFIYMNKANEVKKADLNKYISYLKKSLEIYPCMKTGIKFLIEKTKMELKKPDDEFETYKIQIKDTIKTLIENGKLENAKDILNEYETIVPDDMESVLFRSQISLKEIKTKANSNSQVYKM